MPIIHNEMYGKFNAQTPSEKRITVMFIKDS